MKMLNYDPSLSAKSNYKQGHPLYASKYLSDAYLRAERLW